MGFEKVIKGTDLFIDEFHAALSSKINLSSFFSNTLDFPLDLVKGYGLIFLLIELDGGGGTKEYAEDILPEISAKMTPEQIEQAKAFAKKWKATHPPLSYFPEKLGF